MNRYNSITRRIYALGVIDVALTQPSLFIAANPGYAPLRSRMFQTDSGVTNVNAINPNGVVIIRNVALYSNFADGLVFHSVTPPVANDGIAAPLVTIQALSLDAGTVLPGATVTTMCGSNALTGTGGPFLGLVPGDFILIQNFITRVLAYTDADNITVTTPPLFSAVIPVLADRLRKLNLIGQDSAKALPIWSLNDFHDLDEYVNPFNMSIVGTPAYTVFEGWVRNDAPLYFDTISIDAAWIPVSSVRFSIAADIEYTRR